MALLDYLAGLGYVGFVTVLGLFLAPDPTGVVPLGVLLTSSLVASHALARVTRPLRVLLVSAGTMLGLTVLVTIGFASFGAILPASEFLSVLTLVGVAPAGYGFVLASGVADRETGETAGDDADNATEV